MVPGIPTTLPPYTPPNQAAYIVGRAKKNLSLTGLKSHQDGREKGGVVWVGLPDTARAGEGQRQPD